ncbi:MAG: SHOCT domain-containing protein [Planctomycetota bacterium]|nr:SHOCT domain-containing protein [Planctomycetota bacterium]MDA1179673.1 SHOCT domain-containing protein [Planctomycetota bacterium]
MLCSGCGKSVPFFGDVCPYCLRDKRKDRECCVYGCFLCPLFGFIGFFVVGLVAEGLGYDGGYVGGSAFIGLVIGIFLGAGVAQAFSGAGGETAPPKVSITEKSDGKHSDEDDHKKKLANLKNLFEKNLISEQEYNAKRKEILDKL